MVGNCRENLSQLKLFSNRNEFSVANLDFSTGLKQHFQLLGLLGLLLLIYLFSDKSLTSTKQQYSSEMAKFQRKNHR